MLAAFLGLVPAATWADTPSPPPAPSRYVTDQAGILGQAAADALNATLTKFDHDTSTQVVVWIDNSLPQGQDLGVFALQAFNAWGIGQKGTNNGVLFVVFPQSRAARIQVGRGLSGALPDAVAAQILDQQAFPQFRKGDYAAGVQAAVQNILLAARGTYPGGAPGGSQPAGNRAPIGGLLLVGLVVTGLAGGFAVATGRRRRRSGIVVDPYLYTYHGGGWLSGADHGSFVRGGVGDSSGDGGFTGGGGTSDGGGASGGW